MPQELIEQPPKEETEVIAISAAGGSSTKSGDPGGVDDKTPPKDGLAPHQG